MKGYYYIATPQSNLYYTGNAVYVRNTTGSTVTDTTYYLHKDHLGSLATVVLSAAGGGGGSVVGKYSYDVCVSRNCDSKHREGRRRNYNDFTYTLSSSDPLNKNLFDRFYTMHETVLPLAGGVSGGWGGGLINMNGRLYDPLLARMLSPDNYVQAAGNTQSYNRYSYCVNNPLKFTDPDGQIFVPMLIGAAVGVLTNGINNSLNGNPFFMNAGSAAFSGAIGGMFSYSIGQAAMGMTGFQKIAFQTLAHGNLGGMMSVMNGGTYGQGFLSGAAGSLVGSGAGSLLQNAGSGWQALGTVGAGALSGGIGAEIAGGNFWDGARNGAISAGLNHLAHSIQEVNPERLKARILADGKLTLKEANQWYRYGKGVALTVDASKIDLDFINPDDYTEGAQGYSNVQTLFSSRDGRVYGNIGIRRVSGNQFQIHPDNYGFETHNGSGAQTWIRNQATKIGASYAGEGAPYDIYFRGYNTISPQYYYQQLYQRSNF